MPPPVLYLSRDPEVDFLRALEFGGVAENQPEQCWLPLSDEFAFWRPAEAVEAGDEDPRGFSVGDFSTFDERAPEYEEDLWSEGPRFAAPLLGLESATGGEIITAARSHFGDEPSVNRALFDSAVNKEGEEAIFAWRDCLEAGDSMAHFALGYTLYELGRHREAYSHLRVYVRLAPRSSWNWCWFGKAAAALGESEEAEDAFERAIELTEAGDDETEASKLLADLRSGR